MKNWKTSLQGIASVVLYVIGPQIWPQYTKWFQYAAMIFVAGGFLTARDGGNGSDRPGNENQL